MKKRILTAALIAFMVIFGNMTVFAASEDIDGYDEYTDEYDYEEEDSRAYYYDKETGTYYPIDEYSGYYDYVDDYYDDYDDSKSSSHTDSYYSQNSTLENPYRYYNKVFEDVRSFFVSDYYLDETVYYYDESERFTQTQKQKIIDLLKETSYRIGFNLAVYTGGYARSDEVTQRIAALGSEGLFGKSAKNDTVFLYVDLDGFSKAYDYMDCYREPCLYYFATAQMEDDEVTRIDRILEQMQTKFPAGGAEIRFDDIYAGLKIYCEQLEYYKNMGPDEGAYYYNSDTGKYVCASNGRIYESDSIPRPFTHRNFFIFLALFGGVLTAGVIYGGVTKTYQFKTPASASVYTSQNKIFVVNRVDQFLGSDITKTRIESSSSHHSGSHHSSGSHHHSGGGRSGHSGGGRHR